MPDEKLQEIDELDSHEASMKDLESFLEKKTSNQNLKTNRKELVSKEDAVELLYFYHILKLSAKTWFHVNAKSYFYIRHLIYALYRAHLFEINGDRRALMTAEIVRLAQVTMNKEVEQLFEGHDMEDQQFLGGLKKQLIHVKGAPYMRVFIQYRQAKYRVVRFKAQDGNNGSLEKVLSYHLLQIIPLLVEKRKYVKKTKRQIYFFHWLSKDGLRFAKLLYGEPDVFKNNLRKEINFLDYGVTFDRI